MLIPFTSTAQNVGINATGAAPDNSALLDIDAAPANNKGLLIPRVALNSISSNTPIGAGIATSLLVYNTALINDVFPGYYYWNGIQWVRFINSGNSSGGDWALLGNSGTSPAANFLGTTDNQDLVFRTNNTERIRVLVNGNVGIGTAAPTPGFRLDIANNTGGSQLKLHSAGGSSAEIHLWDAPLNTFGGIIKYSPSSGSNNFEFYNFSNSANSTVNLYVGSGQQNAGLIINNSNNVGIGTAVAAFQLQLSNNSAAKPTSNVWTVISDKRLKTNISSYKFGLLEILQINPIWFTYTGEAGMPKETGVGVIAQELQKIAPYMVTEWEYKSEKDSVAQKYLGVDNGAITYMLVNAIKELKLQNDTLLQNYKQLQEEIKYIKTKL